MLSFLKEHIEVAKALEKEEENIIKAAKIVKEALKSRNKILLCGNGGSAADSQHIAAELTGRYKKERKGLPAVALTTDTSALTAIGNDYGFDFVFARQVEALGEKGDVLIAISTSGNSKNVIEAIKKAKEIGLKVINLIGKDGGKMKGMGEVDIIVPSNNTPRIQEMHIFIGHTICELVEKEI